MGPAACAAKGGTINDQGFCIKPNGNFMEGEITPGMVQQPQGQVFYDAAKDLNYQIVNGRKKYISPVSSTPTGETIYKRSLQGPPITDTGGGLVHGRPQWNSDTGQWDVGIDPGKLLSWGVGAGLGAGALNAAGIFGGIGGGGGGTTTGIGTLKSVPEAAGSIASAGAVTSGAGPFATGAPLASGAGMSFLDFLKQPSTILDIAKTGLSGVGSFLRGRSESRSETDRLRTAQQGILAEMQLAQQKREDEQRAALAKFLQSQIDTQQTQAKTGVDSTQLDPYAPANFLNAANVRRSFAGGLPSGPSSRFTGQFDMSALSPENLAKTGDYFYSNVAAASPNVPLGGVSPNAEAFRQTYSTQQQDLMKQILAFLQQIGGPQQRPSTLPTVI